MASPLLEQMRRANERKVSVPDDKGDLDRLSFTVRRPPLLRHVRAVNASRESGDPFDMLRVWLVGWSGFLENDLFPSGTDDPAKFDEDLAVEWISDRLKVLERLTDETQRLMAEFVASRDELKGNS